MGKIVYDKLFAKLKEKGVTTYQIREKKIVGQGTLNQLRKGDPVSTKTIATFCEALDCQPGDLLEYIPDEPEENTL